MRTVLIDADYIPYLVCHVKKDQKEKSLEQCKLEAAQVIHNIITNTESTHYITCLTYGKCFRYDIFREYKANRKNREPLKWAAQVKDYIADEFKAFYDQRYEADDLLRVLHKNIPDSFVATPDKDLNMLEGVSFNPVKNMWIDTTKEEAEEFFWCSMIKGDTADGIPGLKGKGESFFKKLKSTCINKNISLSLGVFEEYLKQHGEVLGIEEFYKNFKCLYIVSEINNLELPTPVEYIIEKDELTKFLEGFQ